MNYIHFSAIDLGGGGHISVMRRGREVEAGRFYFLQTIFNTPSKRAIPFPFQITKISFCERTVKIKQRYIRSICNVKHNSLKFQRYKRKKMV